MASSEGHALAAQYQLRFGGLAEYRNAVWRVLCAEFFARFIAPSATVLDLGAGWGEFSTHIAAQRKFAMDLNPETAVLLPPGVTFIEQDCSEVWPIEDEALDVVFTSNFLEHLPDKAAVRRTVEQAFRCLRPGGRLICMGPNIRHVCGAYWDFWDHHIALTDRSLSELLRLSGFHIDRQVPRFLPYTMSEGWRPPVFLVGLYLRLPVVWRFFGGQFLVIGSRPGPAAAGWAR